MICCLILEPNLMIGSSCNIWIYPKYLCWAWEEWAGGILEILACLPFVSLGVGGLFDEKSFFF